MKHPQSFATTTLGEASGDVMMVAKNVHARAICSRTLLVILTLIPTIALADEGGISLGSLANSAVSLRRLSNRVVPSQIYIIKHP
jgi:hypothetical protein